MARCEKAGEVAEKVKDKAKEAKRTATRHTGKTVALVVGAAAAVAAAGVAAVKAMSSKSTVYEVKPHDDGWQVTQEGGARATSVHATKKDALDAGRSLAHSKAPSELRIYKQDGGLEDSHHYEPSTAG